MRSLTIALLLIPALALAKPPTKKQIDQELVRMSVEDLAGVSEAEDKLRDAKAEFRTAKKEDSNAALETKAARAWLDSAKAEIKALEAQTKSADAGGAVNERADLASTSMVAEASLTWREARFEAAKRNETLQTDRLTWARALIERAKTEVELERLLAYDNKIGGSPEAQLEIGKQQQALGKAKTAEGKARSAMEKAERGWQDAAEKADQLDPDAGN